MEKNVKDLSPSELADYLIYHSLVSEFKVNQMYSADTVTMWKCSYVNILSYAVHVGLLLDLEKDISGTLFLELSREDAAIIFPKDKQFILGVKIYKHIQVCRSTQEDSTCDYTPSIRFGFRFGSGSYAIILEN